MCQESTQLIHKKAVLTYDRKVTEPGSLFGREPIVGELRAM
jgi:hypothetical protein